MIELVVLAVIVAVGLAASSGLDLRNLWFNHRPRARLRRAARGGLLAPLPPLELLQPLPGPLSVLPQIELTCHGCAHSAADAPWPGHPSGERPCCFCVRNPEREQWAADHECHVEDCRHPVHGRWYDGSPAIKVPSDNYISLDRLSEIRDR